MSTGSLRQQAYQHIQRKILSGELPPGERLSEQNLADEIGISRTPVRSAVRELESEGLLEQVPRYGTIVKKLDRRELAELYDMRVALESFAAECVAEKITPRDIQMLRQLCEEMHKVLEGHEADPEIHDPQTISRFVEADMNFHLVILRATGNRRLMKSVAGSRMLSQWGGFARKQHDVATLTAVWNHHVTLVNALQAKDPERARCEMADHIRFSKRLALELFDLLQAEGDALEVMQWAAQ